MQCMHVPCWCMCVHCSGGMACPRVHSILWMVCTDGGESMQMVHVDGVQMGITKEIAIYIGGT